MKFFSKLMVSTCLLSAVSFNAVAGIVFSFTESGGNVIMQSSGVLDTTSLISQTSASWGGIGTETNNAPESDIMGDTTMGSLDLAFGFSAGTDLSPWIGDMFTLLFPSIPWVSSGTTQFATYYLETGGIRTPGIGLAQEDLINGLWTPDVSWIAAASFASIGLTVGDYTITDAQTGEFISIQIGEPISVAAPSVVVLLGLGVLGIVISRKFKL
ncbi:hypothetical protein [uncultured Paraglaciecola sp.]|uniref:hypothetical protein n=1 Tax=uncultured Paraglaciecola sp. TaxID=1765024 RepID=UPI0026025A57|nr:hypothetical protein [uncultured Paraglaciecola sp.]